MRSKGQQDPAGRLPDRCRSEERRARRRGCSLGRLIEEALHRELARYGGVRPPEVPVFRGATGPQPGVDLTSNRALLDLF